MKEFAWLPNTETGQWIPPKTEQAKQWKIQISIGSRDSCSYHPIPTPSRQEYHLSCPSNLKANRVGTCFCMWERSLIIALGFTWIVITGHFFFPEYIHIGQMNLHDHLNAAFFEVTNTVSDGFSVLEILLYFEGIKFNSTEYCILLEFISRISSFLYQPPPPLTVYNLFCYLLPLQAVDQADLH